MMASVADILSDIKQDLGNFYAEETLAGEKPRIEAFKRQATALLNLINKRGEWGFFENDNTNMLNLYQLAYKLVIQIKEWATRTKEQYVVGLYSGYGKNQKLIVATPTIDELLDCTTLLQNSEGKLRLAINNLQGLNKIKPAGGKAVNSIHSAFTFLNQNAGNISNIFKVGKRNYGQKFESAIMAASRGFAKSRRTTNLANPNLYNKYFPNYVNLNQDLFTSAGSDIANTRLNGNSFEKGDYSIEAKLINMNYANLKNFFGAGLVNINTLTSVLTIIQNIFQKANIGEIRNKLNTIVFSKNRNVDQVLKNYQNEMDEDIKQLVDKSILGF